MCTSVFVRTLFFIYKSRYLPLYSSKYVSKLTFDGSSSKFINDISFVEMNPEDRERYSEQGIEKAKPLKENLWKAISDRNIDTQPLTNNHTNSCSI